MSKENIGAKIFALTNVVKGLNDIEIICLNSRDNFEENNISEKKNSGRNRRSCYQAS